MKSSRLFATAVSLLVALPACFAATATETPAAVRRPDVIFVPTPQPVVDAMLQLAKVQPGEMVYDLGCGDGRSVITAARDFGARGIGVDIDPKRIAESQANAEAAGVQARVQFKQQDLFTMQFSDADVLFLYLLPDLNVRLRPRILDELRPGTRVVSHSFRMAEWEPDDQGWVGTSPIFLWYVPAKVAGEWTLTLPNGEEGALTLVQEFQKVYGMLKTRGQPLPLSEGRVKGRTLTFGFGEGDNAGTVSVEVEGQRLSGTVQRGATGQPEPLSGRKSELIAGRPL